MKKELVNRKINLWRPNLFQKLLYKLRIKKDPRYNGNILDSIKNDEFNCYQKSEAESLSILLDEFINTPKYHVLSGKYYKIIKKQ